MQRWIVPLFAALSMLLPGPAIEMKAKAWIRSLQTGSWNRAQLTAKANALLTPALARGFAASYKVMGKPQSFRFTGSQSVPGGTEYNYLVTLQHAQINEQFILDDQGKLAYLFTPAATPHLSQDALLHALEQRLDRDAAADRFAGTVLIARDGQPVFAHAYGFADREHKIPNTLQTRFRIGSMNKMFTAVAVLQLVQAGKVRLNEPFGTYVTDYPNKSVSSRVTIAQLLSHTGGTGDFFGPIFDKHRLDLKTLDDYEHIYGRRGLVSPPGTYSYSNYGYVLLGLIIERVTGESYDEYIRTHVYAPAGMTASGSLPVTEHVPNLSVGYMSTHGRWIANTATLPYRGNPAGGGYSTVGDLLRFANALQAHKLLNGFYTKLLITAKVATHEALPFYAYGFGNEFYNGSFCIGHNGGAPGMSGQMDICQSGYTVAVLSNLDPPAAFRIAVFADERLPLPQ